MAEKTYTGNDIEVKISTAYACTLKLSAFACKLKTMFLEGASQYGYQDAFKQFWNVIYIYCHYGALLALKSYNELCQQNGWNDRIKMPISRAPLDEYINYFNIENAKIVKNDSSYSLLSYLGFNNKDIFDIVKPITNTINQIPHMEEEDYVFLRQFNLYQFILHSGNPHYEIKKRKKYIGTNPYFDNQNQVKERKSKDILFFADLDNTENNQLAEEADRWFESVYQEVSIPGTSDESAQKDYQEIDGALGKIIVAEINSYEEKIKRARLASKKKKSDLSAKKENRILLVRFMVDQVWRLKERKNQVPLLDSFEVSFRHALRQVMEYTKELAQYKSSYNATASASTDEGIFTGRGFNHADAEEFVVTLQQEQLQQQRHRQAFENMERQRIEQERFTQGQMEQQQTFQQMNNQFHP